MSQICLLAALAGAAFVSPVCVPAAMPASAPTVSTVMGAVMADEVAAAYKKIVEERSAAIVTIKYVLKQGDEEQEEEVQGVLIEEGGLVMTSNTLMGGVPEAYKRMMGGRMRSPKDIKVMVGDDNEGVEAKLIARDSELDLAWVQITKVEGKKFKFVDLARSGKAELGDRLLVVERLGKFMDRAPVVAESRVKALVSKPRVLVLPGSEFASSFGMPAFNDKAEYVGTCVLQLPSAEEMEASQGGMFGGLRNFRGAVVLPAADVVKATAQAKETAKSGKPVDEEPPAADKDGEKDASKDELDKKKPADKK